MDKNQEVNLRLTILMKALDRNPLPELGFEDMDDVVAWVLAPTKASIIQANSLFTKEGDRIV